MDENLKVAIVYDWIDKWGGIERVLLTMAEIFPKAHFYTSYFNEKEASWAKDLDIRTSFIQHLPSFIRKRRMASVIFYPYAFESFNLSNYNIVISVSSSFAKGVITKADTLHVCYLLTPTRYFWLETKTYLNTLFKKMGNIILPKLRRWDFVAAQRPDYLISISKTAALRTQKIYRRESTVIYPGLDTDYWIEIKDQISKTPMSPRLRTHFDIINSPFFLAVSRLEPYKKVDLLIKTFNKLKNHTLIVVGQGSLRRKLRETKGKNIHFFSKLTDREIAILYSKASALIIPQEEDFGYVSLEAQFFGCPIIAFKRGGSTETVIDQKTGIFFEKQTMESLIDAIERFNQISYNLQKSAKIYGPSNISRFDKEKFVKEFVDFINSKRI